MKSRDEQDEYALRSQQRAQAAIESGRFNAEVVTLEVESVKRGERRFSTDEHSRANATHEGSGKAVPRVFQRRERLQPETRQASLTVRRRSSF